MHQLYSLGEVPFTTNFPPQNMSFFKSPALILRLKKRRWIRFNFRGNIEFRKFSEVAKRIFEVEERAI